MNTKMIPGAILQGAIMGALRISGKNGTTFSEENGLDYHQFRAALFGVSMTGKTDKLREKIIDLAGRETVEHLYKSRMLEEAKKLTARAS